MLQGKTLRYYQIIDMKTFCTVNCVIFFSSFSTELSKITKSHFRPGLLQIVITGKNRCMCTRKWKGKELQVHFSHKTPAVKADKPKSHLMNLFHLIMGRNTVLKDYKLQIYCSSFNHCFMPLFSIQWQHGSCRLSRERMLFLFLCLLRTKAVQYFDLLSDLYNVICKSEMT